MSTQRNTILGQAIRAAMTAGVLLGASSSAAFADTFLPGNLIVSETDYADVGPVASLTSGQTLPYGGTSVGDGSFSNVFKNESVDASFGVTSPIFIDQMTTSGTVVNKTAIDSSIMTTSFASKSELALNISTDGTAVTFMGYAAPVGTLDVSNSNTAQVVDSTNPVTSSYARAIASIDLASGNLSVTDVNAYSGNNGRAVIDANGVYYMVGNAGNGSANGAGLTQLSNNTGVQSIAVGSSGNTTAIGAPVGTSGSSTGYQNGFGLQQLPNPATPGSNYAADKSGKDDNFRGETLFNNTLYVTKGSGSNGVDTVYQVGATGALANGQTLNPTTTAITVLPGFNAVSEKVIEGAAAATPTFSNPGTGSAGVAAYNALVTSFNATNATAIAAGTIDAKTYETTTATEHPFGLWFANSTTLFVADEGDGVRTDAVDIHNKNTSLAGLEEWNLSGGVWTLSQVFQHGLVGVIDTAASTALGWSVQEDGLRNITGTQNADGSYTIYGTTSTVSNETTHDLGADPNQIVAITIGATSTAANTSFTILQDAVAGQRFGGLAIAPAAVPAAVPLPPSLLMMLSGLGITGLFARRNKRA